MIDDRDPVDIGIVAAAVRKYQEDRGYSPRVRDVANIINRSISVTHGWLVDAKEAGLVDWEPKEYRTLHYTGDNI